MISRYKTRSISVKSAHSYLDFSAEISEGTTVIFGENGVGKTTLLHILTNVLNRDFDRFRFLNFKEIVIMFDDIPLTIRRNSFSRYPDDTKGGIEFRFDGNPIMRIELSDSTNPNEVFQGELFRLDLPSEVPRCIYVPAFRSVIDSWKTNLHPIPNQVIDAFARKWGDAFWPNNSFPSLGEIEEKILRNSERSSVSNLINLFNQFLVDKKIVISRNPDGKQFLELTYSNSGMRAKSISVLSSGERQMVTLLYAASDLAEHGLVLIDEPEISLNALWQRRLIDILRKQIDDRQLIICTHSPMIGSSHSADIVNLSDTSISSSHNLDIPFQ